MKLVPPTAITCTPSFSSVDPVALSYIAAMRMNSASPSTKMTRRDIAWIAKACLPYFFLMVLAILLLYWFPGLVTWLPSRM